MPCSLCLQYDKSYKVVWAFFQLKFKLNQLKWFGCFKIWTCISDLKYCTFDFKNIVFEHQTLISDIVNKMSEKLPTVIFSHFVNVEHKV